MSSKNQDDRRRFHRILFDAASSLTTSEGAFDSKLLDISLNGALMEVPDHWKAECGDQAQLSVHLAEEMDINMEVEITHIEDRRVGLHCNHIDMESISHLRRLVELNLGDSALLERELGALG